MSFDADPAAFGCPHGAKQGRPRGELFFHIGHHKTATTWLKSCLFPSLSGLRLHLCRVKKTSDVEKIQAIASSGGRHLIADEGISGSLQPKRPPGFSRERLRRSLRLIAEIDPKAKILVGFREHRSWINAAFAEQAKKHRVDPDDYRQHFSVEELRWQEVLALVEQSASAVFPYLYEELATEPRSLVEDMCRFFGCDLPRNFELLSRNRLNPSLKSKLGHRVAYPFYRVSYALDRMGFHKTNALHRLGSRLGASVDRYGSPIKIEFDPEVADELRRDWAGLLLKVSERRGIKLPAS